MVSTSNPSGPDSSRGAEVVVRASGGGKIKKLLSMGGTFLTVAVLTGLLWVWADQSQLVDQEIPLSFVLATQAESGLILLSVNDGSGEAVENAAAGGKRIKAKVSFKGTRSRLRELQVDLQSGKLELQSYISAGSYWATAEKIPVIDLLNANEDLRVRGITVVQAEPTHITVELDEWVLIDEIKLALKATPESQGFDASIEPAEISVEVTSSIKDTLPKELLVELVGSVPEKITPGMEVRGTVLRELGGLPVKPTLSEVKVILQLKAQSKAKLAPLPLYAVLPVDMIGKYDLKFEKGADKFVVVSVVGPAGELAKLKTASQEKVRAYIRLENKHIKSMSMEGYYPVTVEFEFDDDVRGVKITGPPKTVKVRLEKKLTD